MARIQKADDLGDAFVIIHILTLPRAEGRSHPILAGKFWRELRELMRIIF
jgi:hypothetical protein